MLTFVSAYLQIIVVALWCSIIALFFLALPREANVDDSCDIVESCPRVIGGLLGLLGFAALFGPIMTWIQLALINDFVDDFEYVVLCSVMAMPRSVFVCR